MSPTTNQLIRKGRKKNKKFNRKARYLKGAPQVRATVIATYVMDPRKPNSANRKVARVRLRTGATVTALIPGEGHQVKEHDTVLVCPGGQKDISAKWQVVRGVLNGGTPNIPRKKARSKFGTKRKV